MEGGGEEGAAASEQGETFRFHLIRQGIQEESRINSGEKQLLGRCREAAENPQYPQRPPA